MMPADAGLAFVQTAGAAAADPYTGYGAEYGYYGDSETGLLLLGHRFYDSGTGRFINRDPMGYAGGVDLYGYCRNDRVRAMDPSGWFNIAKYARCVALTIAAWMAACIASILASFLPIIMEACGVILAAIPDCILCGEGAPACIVLVFIDYLVCIMTEMALLVPLAAEDCVGILVAGTPSPLMTILTSCAVPAK